ncbi:MAG: hypothetical protein QM703_18355 [Gemmatales bacterium]
MLTSSAVQASSAWFPLMAWALTEHFPWVCRPGTSEWIDNKLVPRILHNRRKQLDNSTIGYYSHVVCGKR